VTDDGATRTVLVTGGHTGIGRGISDAFARSGARVVMVGRHQAAGDLAVRELAAYGTEALFIPADLTDEAAAASAVRRAANHFGRLDVVVNNAGIGSRRCGIEPQDGAGERLRRMLAHNLESAYFVAAHALPLLARHRGCIVNISSTAALHGTWGNYGIAKAAVEALTRSLAVQGAPYGVRANGVSPGWVSTDVTRGCAQTDVTASLFQRMGTPAEIAAAVSFLASSDASFVTGQTLIVDGGLSITDYPSQPWLADVGQWKLFPPVPE
jgi:NAD(P)-dependent dehydrogenase (short-subunit alcohol dehydrogenase family)